MFIWGATRVNSPIKRFEQNKATMIGIAKMIAMEKINAALLDMFKNISVSNFNSIGNDI
jgi:hypothetical protein